MTSNFDVNNFSSHCKSHERPMFFSHAFPCVYFKHTTFKLLDQSICIGGSCWLYKMMHQNNIILTHSSWSFKQKYILKIEIIKFYSLGIFFLSTRQHITMVLWLLYLSFKILKLNTLHLSINNQCPVQWLVLNFWDQSLLRSLQRTKWEQKAMKLASFCQFKHHFMREM